MLTWEKPLGTLAAPAYTVHFTPVVYHAIKCVFCHISNNNFLFFMLKQPGDHQYVWEKKTIVLEKVSKRTVMCLKSILYS